MSKQSATTLISERMTKFERAVVFRVARGYFFLMAIAAVVVFVGGVVTGARSLTKTEIPPPTLPPVPSARPPLSLQVIQAELDREKKRVQQAGNSIEVKAQPTQAADVSDPEEARFDELVARLRALFPDPPYSWNNEVEQTCTTPTSFGCLQWGTRVKRYGVVGAISNAVQGMERSEVSDYLTVLAEVLKNAPVERRLELVGPTISAERRARADHEALLAKHKRSIKEIESEHENAVVINDAKYKELREMGAYGLAAGFALLIVVSLFLAFLSMERHTRALEAFVANQAAVSQTRNAQG